MVTGVEADTVEVLMVKVALVAPAGTVTAAELANALLHAADAHAKGGGRAGLRRDTFALILYFKQSLAIPYRETYMRGVALRMAVDVGETFLKHAEEGQFGVAREADITGGFVAGFDATALRKSLEVPANRGG